MRHLVIVSLLFALFRVFAADVFVSTTGSDTTGDGSTNNPFATIGKATGSAAAGDTIYVAFGTYVEQLTLTKNVTLIGNGAPTTIIRCPGAVASNVPNITTPASPSSAIVAVLGATVSLKNLAVSGPGPTNCNSIMFGVFAGNGGTVNLDACRVTSIRDNPLTGCQNGRAVAAGSTALGQAGTANLEGCEISDYQKSGLSAEGATSALNANHCTITGVGPTATLAQNGILVADGAATTIANCNINDNNFTTGPTASCGLLVIGDSSGVKIGGLSFSGNNADLVGLAITITSQPKATPNPAQPGEEVTLVVAGAVSTGSITYAWDFGDGTTLGGDSVKHTWTAEGVYRAEVTLTSTAGNTQKTFVDVTIAIPPPDPNKIEPLNVFKKNARGKNPSTGRDSFQLRGTLDLPKDVSTLDGPLTLKIGSVSADFTIDAKGKSAKDPNKNIFRVKGKYKKKVLTTQTVQFQSKLNSNFLQVLGENGLDAGASGSVKIPVRVIYKNTTYGQDVTLIVKGTAKGFSGK